MPERPLERAQGDAAWEGAGGLGATAFSLLLEHGFIDVVLGDLAGDTPARKAADSCAAADIAARLLQRLANVLSLEVRGQLMELVRQGTVEVDMEGRGRRDGGEQLRRQIGWLNERIGRGHAGALDGVLEFTDVAGPAVVEQHFHGWG